MGVTINLRAGTASGGDADGDDLGEMIENVMGSDQDDMLTGDRGVNSLWGLGGNDMLYGDRGNDMLYGGMGDDELDGEDGDDTLEGGYGADELTGGGGDDTASYTRSMMGVTVRLHASQAMGGDAEGDTWGDVTTETYMLPDEDGDLQEHEETVPDIINLTGSGMADILAGDSRANRIEGGGGDDKIYGGPGGGNDTLHGDGGDDMIFGGHGVDTIFGGDGDDVLNSGAGADTIYGGAGSDMIYATNDDAVINGWLAPWEATDTDANSDYEGPESSTPGTAAIEADEDPKAVDTVSFEKSKIGVTATLAGPTITNVENLIGTNEDDTLTGNDGDNVIEGLDGADLNMDGGAGNDTVSYEHSDRGVTVNLTTDVVSGGHAQGDTLVAASFENATGSAHDDTLTGDELENVLKGLDGDDELFGGAESDTIEGGAGADEMDGGTSAASTTLANISTAAGQTLGADYDHGADTEPDTLSYASSDAGVHVNLTALTFAGGHAEGDEVDVQRDAYDADGAGDIDPVDVATFESLLGSDHDDRLTGDHRVNMLTGGKGDDSLRGMAGADTLVGGPGADMLDGGEDPREDDNNMITARGAMDLNGDNDQTDAGEGAIAATAASMDIATYAGAMAGITVNLATGRGTAGDAMGDTLVNIEQVVGSSNDDTFIAGPGPDNVMGGDHDGDDPEGGTDMEDGDTISYELSPEGIIVNLTVATAQLQGTQDEDSYAIGDILVGIENVMGSDQDDMITGTTDPNRLMGGDGDDTLTGGDDTAGGDTLMGGAGDDTLTGGDGTDTLMGGAGHDTLLGDGGEDTLIGGAGDDEMTGGADSDTFVFSPDDGDGDDIINTFVPADDHIDLSAFGLSAEELIPLISVRGGTVRIDLRSVGGGTIELGTVTNVEDLEVGGPSADANNTLDTLNVYIDKDGDGLFPGDTGADTTDADDVNGIFIL